MAERIVIRGTPGNDRLNGTPGDDVIDGGAGADVMTGGTGRDSYRVDNAGDQVIEAVGEGFDTIFTRVSYTLAAGQEIEVLGAPIPVGHQRPGPGRQRVLQQAAGRPRQRHAERWRR